MSVLESEDVRVVRSGDREVVVVGTAHVSRESVDLVEGAIAELAPDAVCVELDAKRFEALSRPDRFESLDLREVIEDLKQEFAGPRAGGAATARPAGRPQPLALADDLAPLDIPADLAEQVAGLTANYDLQRIEARLSRLEQSLSATLEILSQVLQAARRETPAGKKAS